jgi:hypothetical protein
VPKEFNLMASSTISVEESVFKLLKSYKEKKGVSYTSAISLLLDGVGEN